MLFVLSWVPWVARLRGRRANVGGVFALWSASVGDVGHVLGWRASVGDMGGAPAWVKWTVWNRGWRGWRTKVSSVRDIGENTKMVC